MDAVKIIKKHGSPGGLPVLTAYVNDTAPGESVTKFLHKVRLVNQGVVDVITDSDTAFTSTTLAKWLYDNGYKTDSTGYNITGSNYAQEDGGATLKLVENLCVYSSAGSSIALKIRQTTVVFDSDNSKLNVAVPSTTSTIALVGTDTVQKI